MLRCLLTLIVALSWTNFLAAADRPNILWITSEDNGPQLGCYGDDYAITPHIDALAAKGCRYLHCWSNAPVCAPARTTIITGMYPTSLGAQHMRSMVKLPEGVKLYPQYLREAGYYCTNNSKEDYNVEKPAGVWDDSSRKGHWKNRPEGQPFFSIFNHTISHESQIRNKIDEQHRIHDPAQVRVPAYHPDTPEVRKDWAQYYDRLTMMDKLVGKNLRELEEAGLTEDTIVFYYGDHGSGMPRSKRMPYNSGLHVPLIVYIPEKWQHLATDDYEAGGATDRLVSFVDLAPTLLSLIGVDIPEYMQGHAFLGPQASEPQPYIYGFRGRMDERPDMMRSITDGRYVYIRNFMPHRPCGQHVDYMFQTPTTRVWYEMWKRGECNEVQSHFWEPKPAEELYDLQDDPDEVVNLVSEPDHIKIRNQLHDVVLNHMRRTRDAGLWSEAMIAEMNAHSTIRDEVRRLSDGEYEFQLLTADRSLMESDADLSKVAAGDTPVPPAYWRVLSILRQGEDAIEPNRESLRAIATEHSSPSVAVVAAEALGRYGNDEDLALALPVLLEYANAEQHGVYNAVAALNAIGYLGEKADSIRDDVAKLPKKDPNAPSRTSSYCGRLIEKITADSN